MYISGGGSFLLDIVYIELFVKSIKQLPWYNQSWFVKKFFIQLLHFFHIVAMGFHINDEVYGWQQNYQSKSTKS